MSIYMNPLTDFAFKKLFGEPSSKNILIDFLNTMLKENHQVITDITIMNTEQLGITKDDRVAVFDLYCINEHGEQFVVEIQRAQQVHFKDRTVCYSSFLIQKQGRKGSEWNYELKPLYIISLLDFIMDRTDIQSDKFYHKVKLLNVDSGELFYEKFTFVYLELPKFKKHVEQIHTHFDKWVYLFRNMESLQTIPEPLNDRIFMELLEKAKLINLKDYELSEYETTLKRYRDNRNVIDSAKFFGYEDGKAEGKIEGKAEGKLENKIEVAILSKKEGLPIPLISKLTGLSEKEIEELK